LEYPFAEFVLTEFKLLERRRKIERKLKAEEVVTQNLKPLKFETLTPLLGWIPNIIPYLNSFKSSLNPKNESIQTSSRD
jgi:hypothetical protein